MVLDQNGLVVGATGDAAGPVGSHANPELWSKMHRKIDDMEDRQIRCSGLNGQCLGILCLAPQAGQAALQRSTPYKSSFTPQRKFPIIRPLRTFCDREDFYWRDRDGNCITSNRMQSNPSSVGLWTRRDRIGG